MIWNVPLSRVALGSNGKVDSPIYEAQSDAPVSAGAFRTQVNESLCTGGAHIVSPTLIHDLEFPSDRGPCVIPLIQNLALSEKFGIHAEQSRLNTGPGQRCRLLSSQMNTVDEVGYGCDLARIGFSRSNRVCRRLTLRQCKKVCQQDTDNRRPISCLLFRHALTLNFG
jgi:hypothetical protein